MNYSKGIYEDLAGATSDAEAEDLTAEDLQCPMCDENEVDTEETTTTFHYGDDDSGDELVATVPVHTCRACGFQFTDSEGEERRHEAICDHLSVLNPKEIRTIRGDLSQVKFAELTRLGVATIGRWERGELIQNGANDQLLFLLTFPENFKRLRHRISGAFSSGGSGALHAKPQLRALDPSPQLRRRANEFRLVPSAG